MSNGRDLIGEGASSIPSPTLVNGEDPANYDQLAARIIAAVAPANVIEGEFTLVPDGGADAVTRGQQA
jgi:hypothetical protein